MAILLQRSTASRIARIRGMLAVSGEEIDRAMLEDRVAELGLDDLWRRVSGA